MKNESALPLHAQRPLALLPRFTQRRWIYLALLCVFYLSFNLWLDIIIAGDSGWYIESSVRVSPLYPLIIRFFRLLFSDAAFPRALVIFQQLLLAYAIFSLTDMLERFFPLRWYWRAACCVGLAFFLYMFRLLIIGSDTDTFFCNAVLTEGVAYPLYLLFFKYWFAALRFKSGRMLLYAAAVAFLLTAARGQFYWLLIALFIGFAVLLWHAKQRLPLVLKALGSAVAYALLTLLLSAGYHYAATGAFTGTTLGTEVTLAAVLYDCDADAAAFLPEGSEAHTVLQNTLRKSAEQGWLVGTAQGSIFERYRHYEDSFDPVRQTFLDELAAYHGVADRNALPAELLKQSAHSYAPLVPRLILDHLPAYVHTRLLNLLAGVVRANSVMNPMGAALSLAVYLGGLLLLLITRKRPAYACARLFLSLTLLCVLLNALFCCFGVFALSRYMYYNFPLVYLGLALFVPAYCAARATRQDAANCAIKEFHA